MSQLSELVDLPDPAVQPLVHPLDLAGARHLFRNSWLIGVLTSPAVALGTTAIVWFLSGSYVVALIVGAVIVIPGSLATRFYRDEAWGFIPRKRQDRGRHLPFTWQLVSGLILALLLVVAVVLVGVRLADVPRDVREVIFGMAVGTGVIVALDLIARMRDRGGDTTLLSTLPVLVALAACVVIAYRALLSSTGFMFEGLVVWGVATMLVVGGAFAVWRRVATRPGTNSA